MGAPLSGTLCVLPTAPVLPDWCRGWGDASLGLCVGNPMHTRAVLKVPLVPMAEHPRGAGRVQGPLLSLSRAWG